tara:strand:- start:1875 stop:2240 length:366 start_codon:yes stop_codon:yes gene_type:complete
LPYSGVSASTYSTERLPAPKFRRKPYISWKFKTCIWDYGESYHIVEPAPERGLFLPEATPLSRALTRQEQIESAMNSLVRFLVITLLLLAAIGGGLIYLGQAGSAPVQSVEKVLPDDQFPR